MSLALLNNVTLILMSTYLKPPSFLSKKLNEEPKRNFAKMS